MLISVVEIISNRKKVTYLPVIKLYSIIENNPELCSIIFHIFALFKSQDHVQMMEIKLVNCSNGVNIS